VNQETPGRARPPQTAGSAILDSTAVGPRESRPEPGWRHPVLNRPGQARRRSRGLASALLRVPLFYKLFLANGAIVVGVTAVSGAISAHLTATPVPGGVLGPFVVVAGAGVALSLLANAVIVWVALTPIRRLEQTAASIRGGDLKARAAPTPLADRDLERLTVTFNDVLDAVVDQTRRLREMAARAQAATEEERRRLARELHDGIAQSLAALNIRVRLARGASDQQVRDSVLDEVSGGISDAILELRRMARGLRPPALEMLGLAAAIESHTRSIGETAGVTATVRAGKVSGLLSPDVELALYRILQESLSNVIRHAGASRVEVDLRRVGGQVQLAVQDDGRGFDTAAVDGDDRGLGLFGMKERAEFIGGRLKIRSSPGQGTRVVVSVPVAEGALNGR